jgi:hypothetical protein
MKLLFSLWFGPMKRCKHCGTIRLSADMHHAFGYGWFCSESELQDYRVEVGSL